MSKRQDDFEQTALPHTGRLLRFARRLTGGVESAEDLVQESLLLAWKNFGQLRENAGLRPWLYRILLNAHYSQTRKRRVATIPLEDALTPSRTQESLEVRQAVEALPPDQKTVILLAIVEGFTCTEVAEILSIPVGTVMSRLGRARQALREKLTLEHKTNE